MKNLVQRAGRLALALVVVGGVGLSSCKKDSTVTVYGNWVTNNPGSFRGVARQYAVSFVIDGVAYAGTGVDNKNSKLNDFYTFNPTSGGGWGRVTPIPGTGRHSAVAFVVGKKAYVGSGIGDYTNPTTGTVSSINLADFWEFDPSGTTTTSGVQTIGTWKRMADMPVNAGTTGRYGAVAAGLGNYGYVGCGNDGNAESDFYRFDPANNRWSELTPPYIGNKRVYGSAFVLGSSMYVCAGINNSVNVTDVAAFDGTKWTAKHSLINQTTGSDIYDYSAVARSGAASFSVGSYGYLATGSTRTDCYQYDPGPDTWTRMNPFLGAARSNAVGFGIGNYGYVGLGANGSTTTYDDFNRIDPTLEQQ